MMNVMETAKHHFRDKLSGQMQSIDVPEWGEGVDNPLIVYFRPTTLREQDKIFKYIREGSLRAMVERIILCARFEDANKMFKPCHATEFMNAVDPKVIERIALAMGAGEDELAEDAIKN